MRIDAEGNVWTTDVTGHTVRKMNPEGDVLMTLGEHEQPGRWHVGASTGRLTEPTDLAIGLEGEIYVLAQGALGIRRGALHDNGAQRRYLRRGYRQTRASEIREEVDRPHRARPELGSRNSRASCPTSHWWTAMQSLRSVACRSQTLQRIQSLTPESLRRWGKMTPRQMVCHLGDSYQMAIGDRPEKDRSSLWSRTNRTRTATAGGRNAGASRQWRSLTLQ